MFYQPMSAAPQYAPMGWVGDQVQHYAPVIGSVAGGLTTQITESPFAGGIVGGLVGQAARDYGHLIPFNAGPAMAAPQPAVYAPQGVFGSALGSLAGGYIGDKFGYKDVGAALGGIAGSFAPFAAGPQGQPVAMQPVQQPVAYAPQGLWGNIISGAGNVVGGLVGGKAGRTIRDVSSVAKFLPFQAGPAMASQAYAPQGFFGDLIHDVAPIVGDHVGGNWGRVITNVGDLADMLPFQAGPAAAPAAYAPQGWFGDLIHDVAPVVGDHVGGNWGRVITNVGDLADMLPFQAGPATVQQAYAPQGFWGNVISGAGNLVGGVVGGKTGRTIRDVSSVAKFLPFQAGPMNVQQPAYAPQGILGSALGSVAGGLIGGAFGKKGLGSAIGGGIGAFLPFQAGPNGPITYVPVQQPIQQPVQTDQVVYH